jgi:peptidoglycan hydrolase-like protein with peptidoglycan-binding domain
MTLTKKLSITFIITLALASFLMIATPTHAGFFDWLFGKKISQEASVMKATTAVKTTTPTPVSPSTDYYDFGDGDCAVEGTGQFGTIDANGNCVGDGWEAFPMDARVGTSTPKPTVATTPAKTTALVSSALRLGSESAEVAKLQADMTRLGYYQGSIDSKFGRQLHAAVIAYQRAQGLAADGVVGSGTKARLGWGTTWGGVDKVVTPGVKQPLPVTGDYIDVFYFKDMCLVIFSGGDSYEWGTYTTGGPGGCTTGSGTYRVASHGDAGYQNAVLSSLVQTLTVSPAMKEAMERIVPAPEYSPFGAYWKYRKFGDQCQRILIYTTGSNATPSNDGWVAC